VNETKRELLEKYCRIYFPSQETVENSKGGEAVSESPRSLLLHGFVHLDLSIN
jgi:hypothetical protein